MSYTVLARRYRSATFDEVVGQEHIAQTLKNAIATGRIAHAYLFCGTRGTGKTSTARILAKALNCESADHPLPQPCNQCNACQAIARGDDIDVIEIDAASNTGVDNIRELIENSQYRPARSRFKIYIIDEVHMLSKSAFNALLKTLEEPPSHVKFILATTEPEKVLPTILSRCQRYDFRNIPARAIADHLADLCKKEKIKAGEDALLLVAKAGAGSMRDALSLLDRLLSMGDKELSVERIEQMLGLPRSQVIFDLVQAIGSGDVKAVLQQSDRLIQNGLAVETLIASLVEHLRNLLILRSVGNAGDLVETPGLSPADLVNQSQQFEAVILAQDIAILEELRRLLRQSQAGRALLDATLVRLTLADQFASVAELLGQLQGSAPTRSVAPAGVQKKKSEPLTPASPEIPQDPAQAEPHVSPKPDPTADAADLAGTWKALLEILGAQDPAIPRLLSQGIYRGLLEGVAVVEYDPEHQWMVPTLERNGKKEAVRDALSRVLGQNVGVKFAIVAVPQADASGAAAAPASAPVAAAKPAGSPEPGRAAMLSEAQYAEPLLKAVMEELGGNVVRIEEKS